MILRVRNRMMKIPKMQGGASEHLRKKNDLIWEKAGR